MNKRIVKNFMLSMVLIFSILLTLVPVHAEETKVEAKKFETVDQIIEKMEDLDGKANAEQKGKEILNDSSPEAIKDYIEYVDKEASEMLEDAEPVKSYTKDGDTTVEQYKVKVDPVSSVELTIEDQEEETMMSKVEDLFVKDVQAATNGETKWKKYGKRYFTARYKRFLPGGFVIIKTENHYSVSSSGLKERYANSWIDASGAILTTFNVVSDTIKKRTATKVGSYIQINTKTEWVFTGKDTFIATHTFNDEYTRVKILKFDKANKRIQVKHSWGKIS